MRIKEVELVGFKSFVDKTRFEFDEGISGVVGPNGCGKSNIVDAVRWCMGEMSAKSLRGGEMQDVIFNGTETRKPMGMAQASIIFSCEDGVFPTGYEGMTEIQVTRRLYRSGESEYLINKRPCRLKDIVDLFLDTGIGSRAYAIIEQGEISRITDAKPLERRQLIEEAAGISKYRVKRDEALRKIEATQTNLHRVNDILFEIQRTLNSLKRQAAKAERYHEFKAELKELDLELAAREKVFLAQQAENTQRELRKLGDMRQQAATKLETEDARLAALRLEVMEHEKAINAATEKVAGLRDEVRHAESQRDLLTRDIEHLESQITLWQEDTEVARDRLAALDQEIAATDALLQQLTGELAAAEAELQSRQQALQGAVSRRRQLDRDAEAARNELLGLAGRCASLDQAQHHHRDNREAAGTKLAELSRQRQEAERSIAETEATATQTQQALSDLQVKRNEQEIELKGKRERLAGLQQTVETRQKKFNTVKDAYGKTRVRLESLEEMQRNLEGYQFGVRKIMEAVRQKSGPFNGRSQSILGIMAEKIEVEPRYEAALEAVLGDRLQSVFVADQDMGVTAAGYLKAEQAGRGSFVPLVPRRGRPVNLPDSTLSQSLGTLSSHVTVQDEYRQAAETMLDNYLVVEDLPQAIRLHNQNGYTGAFVTLDGEMVDSAGVITGGHPGAAASGLLQKKREIAELRQLSEKQLEIFQKAEKEYYAAEGMISHLQGVITQGQQALDENRLAIAETSGELKRLNQEIARRRNEIQSLAEQSARLESERERLERQSKEDALRLAEVEKALAAARDQADEKTAAQQALASEIDSRQKAVTEALLAVGELRQKQQAASLQRRSLVAAHQETTGLAAKRLEQIEHARQTQNRHREKIGVLTKGLTEQLQVLDAAERAAVAVREGVDEQIARVEQAEKDLKLLRRDMEGYEKEIHAADLTMSEIAIKRDHLAEKLNEKYELNLEDVAAPSDTEEVDTATLKERAQEINRRIASMGEVNPNAVTEYNEQNERFTHFTTQKQDLEQAIDDLKKAIAKINKTSKERFVETFELINHKFSEVMPTLFGGGLARLVLTEPDKPLESGIDIVVRPPGKRLTNVTLLSGGEKAMTSIGLIFSIFLVKPSPFCVLDEVDAPLDDENVFRFNKLVDQMASHSQVVLITHNKATMEVADRLFGVTMQEKGVSKVVSVHLVKESVAAN